MRLEYYGILRQTVKLLHRAILVPLPPFGGAYFWENPIFHRFILTHKSFPPQIHNLDVLDFSATSALFKETVINSAFTKFGKDMTKS